MRKKHLFKNLLFILLNIIFIIPLQGSNKHDTILSLIKSIPQVEKITEISPQGFQHNYQIAFRQTLDHQHPEKGSFLQKIYLGIQSFDEPTTMITAGYSHSNAQPSELSLLLNTNQIGIEHRYFGASIPANENWDYLNTYQAASDLHEIYESFKELLPKSWLSTGISKGGQTAIYYRYYYPNDMAVVVPYVAPLNYGREDQRIPKFLKKVGPEKCRDKIKEFQQHLLKNSSYYLPLFEKYATEKKLKFDKLGIENAFEFCVLEFDFAFWQWSIGSCFEIPSANSNSEKAFLYLISISDPNFFSDQGIKDMQAFFIQAMSEMGMYDYDTSDLSPYLKLNQKHDFSFTIPKGQIINFDPELNLQVKEALDKNSNHMLFIVGENDPWGATSYTPLKNSDAIRIVVKSGSHRSRLANLPQQKRDSVIQIVKQWLK